MSRKQNTRGNYAVPIILKNIKSSLHSAILINTVANTVLENHDMITSYYHTIFDFKKIYITCKIDIENSETDIGYQ